MNSQRVQHDEVGSTWYSTEQNNLGSGNGMQPGDPCSTEPVVSAHVRSVSTPPRLVEGVEISRAVFVKFHQGGSKFWLLKSTVRPC